jgi:thiol-disulfide isomerase/thioredoxin
VLGGIAIVAAAAIALLLTQGGDTSARPSSAANSAGASAGASAATITGGPLPAFQADVQDAAVGQPIPEVSGSSFDGSAVSIARDGTPKLLLFLAHWCPHCREEVPKVQDWIEANGLPEGVDFVSVATSIDPNRPNYPPDAWLSGEGWTSPVIVDGDDRIATAFGLTAFPYWVAVNGDGTVAQRWTGSVDINQLQGIFDGLRATAPSADPSGRAPASGGASDGAAPSDS